MAPRTVVLLQELLQVFSKCDATVSTHLTAQNEPVQELLALNEYHFWDFYFPKARKQLEQQSRGIAIKNVRN